MAFKAFAYDSFNGDVECLTLTSLEDASHLLVSMPSVTGFGDPPCVYGDAGGAWVDEDYPAAPASESSMSRLIAEKGWLNLGGGIYGPRRSALITNIERKVTLWATEKKRI